MQMVESVQGPPGNRSSRKQPEAHGDRAFWAAFELAGEGAVQ
jgi:hypothetical protein